MAITIYVARIDSIAIITPQLHLNDLIRLMYVITAQIKIILHVLPGIPAEDIDAMGEILPQYTADPAHQ